MPTKPCAAPRYLDPCHSYIKPNGAVSGWAAAYCDPDDSPYRSAGQHLRVESFAVEHNDNSTPHRPAKAIYGERMLAP